MRSAPAAEAEAGPCPLGCRACRTVTLPVNPRGFGFSLRTEKVHFAVALFASFFLFLPRQAPAPFVPWLSSGDAV
jgi:hypothetical protein